MPISPWKLGRVAGIDLFLHPTFLLLPLLVLTRGGGGYELLLTALVFGCVVLHELGHALMARRYGIDTADITLSPIGGVARLMRMPRSPGPELAIALAGPAVNLGIAFVLTAALGAFGPWIEGSLLADLMDQLMWINVGLLLFNMLPVFPMDGGRVLRAALSGPLGRLRATEVAANLGRAVAATTGVLLLLNGWVVMACLAAFVFLMATMELRSVRLDEAARHRDDDWPSPPSGFRWVDRGDGTWRLAPIAITWGHPRDRRGGPWR